MSRVTRSPVVLSLCALLIAAITPRTAPAVGPRMSTPRFFVVTPRTSPMLQARPLVNPRLVVINPFLNGSVAFSANNRVAAFNPFITNGFMLTFPNAQFISNPFGVPLTNFQGAFPNTMPVALSSTGGFNRPMFTPWMGMSGGYGMMSNYGSSGYGSGSSYGMGYSSGPSDADTERTFQETHARYANVTTPSGMNTGRLDWPVGLRVLPPTTDTDQLRQQLEVALAALSQANGEQATQLSAMAMAQIGQLRQRLNDNQYKFASGTVSDARRFLDRLESAVRASSTLRSAPATTQATGY